jgi:hypothetical protein
MQVVSERERDPLPRWRYMGLLPMLASRTRRSLT